VNVSQVLAEARALGVDRLDAQLLLCWHLQRHRSWLLANDDHALGADLASKMLQHLQQRAAGLPLAYVLGETEFCGLKLHVNPAVLIPRPETEMLVEWAAELLARVSASVRSAVDLGTGSGAIALALATRFPGVQMTATDASAAALTVAQGNAQRLGMALRFAQGAWWQPLAGQRFGLAVSNPPYIAQGDPHLVALQHEPQAALTAAGDGLADLRVIVAGAAAHLMPGAWLLLEHGHDQEPAVQALLSRAGFLNVQTRCDLAGLARCSAGMHCADQSPTI
jgi:release factor glutamine methyltransferase